METVLDEVLRIAKAAGALIERLSQQRVKSQSKADGSPVTEADLAADRLIRSELMKLTPELPIISEESSIPSYDVRKTWNRFWLVDGLDGTKEFLAGRDEYTVNIALVENRSPALGVIHAPRQRTTYFASTERGSWKMLDDEAPQRLHSVSKSKTAELVVVESRSHPSLALEKFLSEFRIAQRIKIGSSLKFCLLAEGRADLYARFGPTMEWDVAAGDCIFRFSGTEKERVSPFVYNKPDLKNGQFVLGMEG